MLLLIPGSARAEGEDTGAEQEPCTEHQWENAVCTKCGTNMFRYNENEGNIYIKGFASGITASEIVIPAMIDGKPVVSIYGFKNKTFLTSVKILGENLQTIGSNAFYGTGISSIVIPASVTSIGSNAFYSCKSLTSVKILGENLQKIGNDAFARTGISSIVIPGSVTTIESSAFDNCSSLTSVKILGKNLTTIGGCAFYKTGISSIVIPGSVKTIGKRAFANCSSLTTMYFENYFQGIEDKYKFDTKMFGDVIDDTPAITDVYVLPEQEYSLKNMKIDFINDKISSDNFVDPYSHIISSYDKELGGVKCLGFSRDSYSYINFKNWWSYFTSIVSEAFKGDTVLTTVAIPSSVQKIGEEAFADCPHLTSVTFERNPANGEDLSGYSQNMLASCSGLARIYVPQGCKQAYCELLPDYASIIIEKVVADSCFVYEISESGDNYVCKGTSNGILSKNGSISSEMDGIPVTAIAPGALQGLISGNIYIPASIEKIGSKALADNAELLEVRISGNNAVIENDAFANNPDLKYIYVPNEGYANYAAQTFENKEKLMIEGGAKTLADAEGLSYMQGPTLYRAGELTYERTLDDQAQYATLCMPFALDLGKTEGIFDKVYVPMNTLIHNLKESTPEVDRLILMLQEQEPDAVIPAGQPLFVKLKEGTESISLTYDEDALLTPTLQPKTEAMTVVDWDGTSGLMTQNKQFRISYQGTLQPQEASAEAPLWTFNTDGTFGPKALGTTVLPFRLALSVKKESDADASEGTDGSEGSEGSEGTGSEGTDGSEGSEGSGSAGSDGDAPSASAKQLVISIGVSDGTTTGIRELIRVEGSAAGSSHSGNASDASAKKNGIIYDLNGSKVTTATSLGMKKLRKGIYILDGKKLIVK